jgi:cytochrome c
MKGAPPKKPRPWLKRGSLIINKEAGKEKAIAEIGNPKGMFVKKDLYIYVYDEKGVAVMHPLMKSIIGRNSLTTKDPDGKLFIKEIVDKANANGSGWVDYKYVHPQEKKVEPKSAYFEKIDNLILISGAYK